ncbi:MAG: hypothetical protein ACPGUC_06555 [Gammaproteobacteria bacterium]
MNGRAYENYTVRRVSPLMGCVRVVDEGRVRAWSDDGRTWRVYWLPSRRPEMDGAPGMQGGLGMGYEVALWQADAGPRWQSPRFGLPDELRDERTGLFMNGLAERVRAPFPLGDLWECWWVSACGTPLVLLQTARHEPDASARLPHISDWAPMPLGQSDFHCADLDLPPAALRESLRSLARDAGKGGQSRWLRRSQDGAYLPHGNVEIEPDGPEERVLMACYRAFMAPQLLTWPTLSSELRAQLEKVAVHRPMTLARLHRLIPDYVDRDLVNVALVQAHLRSHG